MSSGSGYWIYQLVIDDEAKLIVKTMAASAAPTEVQFNSTIGNVRQRDKF